MLRSDNYVWDRNPIISSKFSIPVDNPPSLTLNTESSKSQQEVYIG